ncbi:hypothetical protein C6P45_001287 [Maudiozyma exigua]|uniref:protein-histidine N-methyltransferase n=1 Tax=Maudiozyma exigua TaxID=34358 RepID=A0A9P7B632_MAUEX|nr:hypothetical protein C6P45_001287 [Kazachstania exigua]
MSFSFGFTNEDLDIDQSISNNLQNNQINENTSFVNPLDAPELKQNDVIQPQIESLESILASLKDVRVSYESIDIPTMSQSIEQPKLYRRDLFDMKHQLMSEDDSITTQQENSNELDILIHEDLRKNIYEGGLKSWECSIDLVSLLNESFHRTKDLSFNETNCIVEIGCGTALPSEFIFQQYLKQGTITGLNMILTDYNSSALRLATIPNLIITWINTCLNEEQIHNTQPENISMKYDQEIVFSEKLLQLFIDDMNLKNINIQLISGSWGRDFTNLLHDLLKNIINCNKLLVLTSETIYQPDHLPLISETLIDLKQNTNFTHVNQMIAAKDIYFGVGGSLIEFENYLRNRRIAFITKKVNAGLKRSIVIA